MITATWSMSIDEETLIKEMYATGEYGVSGHMINEDSIIEFFRNWAFGLDPNTYKDEWARNPLCNYRLSLYEDYTHRELWSQEHNKQKEK